MPNKYTDSTSYTGTEWLESYNTGPTWMDEKPQPIVLFTRYSEIPEILLHEQSLPKDYTLRSPLKPGNIRLSVPCACKIQINGDEWRSLTTDQFGPEVSAQSQTQGDVIWEIRLESEHPTQEYKIRFRIPDGAALEKIDHCFAEILAVDPVTHDALKQFKDAIEQTGASVKEYGDALYDYAMGILLKEGRHTVIQSHLSESKNKMERAREVLMHFDSPLARRVRASIHFSFNDFDYGKSIAVLAQISSGLSFTSQELGFPLDELGRRLLALVKRLIENKSTKITEGELALLPLLFDKANEYDQVKIRFILADGWLRLGRYDEACQYLQKICYHPSFQTWAQTKLSEIKQ